MSDIVIAMNITPPAGFNLVEAYHKLEELAEVSRAEWVRMAQTELGASAQDYINAITPVEHESQFVQIRLIGWLPNSIEHGIAPFDMKPGLLNGPHAKISKNGVRYNTVPFRHGTPGTSGKSVGAPMPFTHTTKQGKQASLVYGEAKKLTPSVESPTGKTVWGEKTGAFAGGKLIGHDAGLSRRTMLPVEGGRPGAYTWKHSPYEGIYKIQKMYAKAAQNQYISFRRVSSNSNPNSWWHPGIQARNFIERLRAFVDQQIERIF